MENLEGLDLNELILKLADSNMNLLDFVAILAGIDNPERLMELPKDCSKELRFKITLAKKLAELILVETNYDIYKMTKGDESASNDAKTILSILESENDTSSNIPDRMMELADLLKKIESNYPD